MVPADRHALPGQAPPGPPEGPAARRRSPLTRRDVMVKALELIDADGVDSLSLRRLGQALDRTPMTLYRHAESKSDLLDGVVELLLEQVVLHADAPDWRDELRSAAHRYRALAMDHPHAVPLLVTRPLSTPLGLRPRGTLRPLEAFIQLMTRAGMSDTSALAAYRSFAAMLHGHVLDELQEVVADPDEHDDLLRLGLHRLPLHEFPKVRGLARAFSRYDGTAQLDRGLDMLLESIGRSLPEGASR